MLTLAFLPTFLVKQRIVTFVMSVCFSPLLNLSKLVFFFFLKFGMHIIILPVVLYGCETWSLTLGGGTQTEGFWEQSVEEDIWT
jgi:hypothetical protein